MAVESDDEREMRLCDRGCACYRCRSRYLVQICIQAVIQTRTDTDYRHVYRQRGTRLGWLPVDKCAYSLTYEYCISGSPSAFSLILLQYLSRVMIDPKHGTPIPQTHPSTEREGQGPSCQVLAYRRSTVAVTPYLDRSHLGKIGAFRIYTCERLICVCTR